MNSLHALSEIYQRLLSIERYSTTPKTVKENVAAHSFCVAFLCLLFADKHPELDGNRMIKMALVHDQEESLSGDIMSNLKRFHPNVRDALEEAAVEYVGIMLENVSSRDTFVKLWMEYKEKKTDEARFVKIADVVSRIFLMKTEYRLGSKIVIPILANSFLELTELDSPAWILDEIKSILSDVPEIENTKEFSRW